MNKKLATFAAAAIAATIAISGITTQAQAQDAVFLSQDAGHCEIFRALSRVVRPPTIARADDNLS